MPKFTELYLENLKFTTSRFEVWDSLLPAFGMRVGKRTKTFLIVKSGGDRITIGRFPYLKLAQAREKAREAMAAPESDQIKLSEAIRRYLDALKLKPNTIRYYRLFLQKLDTHFPHKYLHDLTPRKIAEATESPHMHQVLVIFFGWCTGQAMLTKSPMDTLKSPGKFNTRDRVLTSDELNKVWHASKTLDRYGSLLQLLILTGQRRGALSQSSPAMLQNGVLTFPGQIMKSGKDHSIPCTAAAEKRLQHMPFATQHWDRLKKQLDYQIEVGAWTVHDIRRTFATIHGQIGTPPHILERLLDHKNPASLGGFVGTIYNRFLYLEPMKTALENYESHLAKLFGEPLV